jgi:hypothetical protein
VTYRTSGEPQGEAEQDHKPHRRSFNPTEVFYFQGMQRHSEKSTGCQWTWLLNCRPGVIESPAPTERRALSR